MTGIVGDEPNSPIYQIVENRILPYLKNRLETYRLKNRVDSRGNFRNRYMES